LQLFVPEPEEAVLIGADLVGACVKDLTRSGVLESRSQLSRPSWSVTGPSRIDKLQLSLMVLIGLGRFAVSVVQ